MNAADLLPEIDTPDLAVHVDESQRVYTFDLLKGLLQGRAYRIGRQIVRAAPSEQDILRETRWATRVRLFDET